MQAALDLGEYMEDRTPWHIWAVGLTTLAWACLGLVRFVIVQSGIAGDAIVRTPELAVFSGLPAWGVAVWALWVLGMVAGSALLLSRSRLALAGYGIAVFGLAGTALCLFGFGVSPVGIYAMPITLATWIVTVATLFYIHRVLAAHWLS